MQYLVAWEKGIGLTLRLKGLIIKKILGRLSLCNADLPDPEAPVAIDPSQLEALCQAIAGAGRGGGLVVTTSNVLQPGTRLENYRAMRQALRDFGQYPLQF